MRLSPIGRGDVADELADVLGWCLLIAADQGIDLAAPAGAKLAKNRQKYPADAVRGSARKYTAYKSQRRPRRAESRSSIEQRARRTLRSCMIRMVRYCSTAASRISASARRRLASAMRSRAR
jgi:hypothetical protein